MSIENPYAPNYGWKIDPDNRQDRSCGPVITRTMTKSEKIKYGIAVDESEDADMKITRENVRQMEANGMSTAEIAEHFLPVYPKMKKALMMAKVTMLLSDKRPGKQKVDTAEIAKTITEGMHATLVIADEFATSDINSHEDHSDEYTDIKEISKQAKKHVAEAARESAEKIKLSQAVDEMMELVPAADNINHPAHYTTGSIEVIDYLQEKMSGEMFEGFCIGNALKYLSRYKHKGGVEDLKKAQWYLSRIIGVMESA